MRLRLIHRGVGVSPAQKQKRGRDAHATLLFLHIALICLALPLMGASKPAPTSTESPTHFRAIDIYIDPHGQPLAAYQLEFRGESDAVKLVGIEGGADHAFNDPPYYDPAALMHNRVILAALSVDDTLPKQKTRVARLHLETSSDTTDVPVHLIVAASPDGSHIGADVSVVAEGVKP